jgi:hypothetical protein
VGERESEAERESTCTLGSQIVPVRDDERCDQLGLRPRVSPEHHTK